MFQILYVSALADHCGASDVSDVIQVSRDHNPREGIRGALVFDGAQFAQLLQGERDKLLQLMQRIEADGRHRQIAVLLRAECDAALARPQWLAGYCEPDTLAPLRELADAAPAQILAAFQGVLAAADLA
ncbi:MAG TPA: BLUF domain-containing protein [Ideonella sp.]|nr:BLUF domain-containing protein [Ideonella sp.]